MPRRRTDPIRLLCGRDYVHINGLYKNPEAGARPFLTQVKPMTIKDIAVEMTMVGGEVVYEI